ncbi:MAG TPA: EpsI family protein, partial [Phycisphaerae bacterium]|nr:EpsI family protein [Phycisphaerae bacterium]
SLYGRIVEGESYYTHGPIIPVVSLFIIWMLIRHTKVPVRPNRRLGLAVLLAGLFLHLMACFARVNFAQGFAFVAIVPGLVLLLWGWPALRRLWFPIAFLVFMIPLPEVTIYDLNFRLKMFATDLGVWLANMVGVIASHSGNRVFLTGDKSLVIANVCNGLRTLISLLAFGALYAYVCRLRGLWRLGLFLMTIPVAVVSNAIRVVLLIAVADIWDVKAATGWVHDSSGVLIYVLAFLFMFGLERLILWARRVLSRPAVVIPLFDDVRRGPEDEGQWGRMVLAVGGRASWIGVAVLLLTAGGVYYLGRSVPSLWTEKVAESALPSELVVNGQRLWGHRRVMDKKVLGILETEDYFYSVYDGPGVAPVDFCVIFSQDNRKGTHPPDQCLEGSGEGIIQKGSVVVDQVDGRGRVPCRELMVQTKTGRQYFLYTYKCGESYTASFWRQQLTIFGNGLLSRDASGALIRLSVPLVSNVEQSRQWCTEFMRVAIPHLDRSLRAQRSKQ